MATSTALSPDHLPVPNPLHLIFHSYKTSYSFPGQIMLFNALVTLVVLPSLCEMLLIILFNPIYMKKT